MEFYTLLTVLMVCTAGFSDLNYRFIRLPGTIGVLLISLVCSVLLVVGGSLYPGLVAAASKAVRSIDFGAC